MSTVENIQANVVNGINLDDLLALRASIEQDPSKGITNWRVTTTWQGQTQSRSEVSGFVIGGEEVRRRLSFDADEPYELGGSNLFPNPQEYKSLSYTVRIKGDGTAEQFAEVHEAVIAPSPNFFNVANAVALKPTLVVE